MRDLPELRKHIVEDLQKVQDHAGMSRADLAKETLADAEKEIKELESKKQNLETQLHEAEKALKKAPQDTRLQDAVRDATHNLAEFNKTFAEHHQGLREIREAMNNVIHEEHIRANGGHVVPHENAKMKLKKYGK